MALGLQPEFSPDDLPNPMGCDVVINQAPQKEKASRTRSKAAGRQQMYELRKRRRGRAAVLFAEDDDGHPGLKTVP